ncbi:MAG: hypothetical protein KGS72_17390 [Cyanobacteria bacterium REEB67]|nr:hypothetical protein [Cyanobacteria bacterium REEB67]
MDQNKTTAVLDKEMVSDEPLEGTLAAAKPLPKDMWDKLGAVAPIISGMLIFSMGGYFTYSYNQQQLRLQEIQTIEKFIPHLMGNDQSKRAAILAISSLTNAELAGKFAQIFASKGTVSALQSMAESGTESDRSSASTALAKALENIAARESKLNEMETAFQQALNEKSSQAAPVSDSTSQIEEANRLEHLADMCRSRGQMPVAESLLKQAVNIRIRVQMPSDAREVVVALKKLAELQQAAGNKEESENTLKKVSLIETRFNLQGQPGAALPPPPAPQHENAGQVSKPVNARASEENAAREKEHEGRESAAESETKKEEVATPGEEEHGTVKAGSPEAEGAH